MVTRDAVYFTAGDIWALSLADGAIRWQYRLNASVPNLKRTYTRPKLIGDVLYAAGSNRVVALDSETGDVIWETMLGRAAIPELTISGDKLIGRMGGTFSTGKRLKQLKSFGAFVIDRGTGELGWQWKKAKDSITNLGVFSSLDQIVLADKHSLYALRLSGDKPEVLREEPLEFKRAIGKSEVVARGVGAVGGLLSGGLSGASKGLSGGERSDPPLDITQVDTSVVVRGQYHVLAHDLESGKNTWSIEFAPPGVSPFALITMGAVATGVAVWNARDNVSRESWAADSVNSISTAYQNEASRRFTASERSARLAFFLTMQEKAHQLVGIDLETGEEVGTVPIAEKDPQFMVDALGRRVYHFTAGGSLRAFEF